VTGKIIEAPRQWLQPIVVPEGGGVSVPVSQSEPKTQTTQEQRDAEENSDSLDTEDEELIEEAQVHEEEDKKAEARRNKELGKLKAHNQVPEKTVEVTEPRVGNMVVIKEANNVRVGEIIEDGGDAVQVQWFGTTTNKAAPRQRWKFLPVWEDRETKECQISKFGSSNQKPSTLPIRKDDLYLVFTKLNLNGTIPEIILDKLGSYSFSTGN